jgi:hypothetical protein
MTIQNSNEDMVCLEIETAEDIGYLLIVRGEGNHILYLCMGGCAKWWLAGAQIA